MPAVVFYISGHGFGHAVRQIEIINAFAALSPATGIIIRTTAPRWLFERTARSPYTLVEGEVDTGVIQHDSLTPDEAATIERAAAFYADLEERARHEAEFLRAHGAALVVTDAPPLACTAASRARIPSVVCSNFTWDWIYEAYHEWLPSAPGLLRVIRDAYAGATAAWRLPMHGGFETVSPVVDVPFVATRPSTARTRDSIRRVLRLPTGMPLALVSFGRYGVEGLPLGSLDCAASWRIVVTGASSDRSPSSYAYGHRAKASDSDPVISVNEAAIYSAGLGYQDLVRAVDVVITKPGYGIITDCIANGTAMLYTARGRFAEYDVLVEEMPRFLRCRFIDAADLRAGRWREALDALVNAPPPPETPRLDGAGVVAQLMKDLLTTSRS